MPLDRRRLRGRKIDAIGWRSLFQLFLKAFEKCLLRGVELDDGGLDGFVVDVGAAAFDLDVPMSAGLSRDDVASVASVACVTVDPVDVGVRALWGVEGDGVLGSVGWSAAGCGAERKDVVEGEVERLRLCWRLISPSLCLADVMYGR